MNMSKTNELIMNIDFRINSVVDKIVKIVRFSAQIVFKNIKCKCYIHTYGKLVSKLT